MENKIKVSLYIPIEKENLCQNIETYMSEHTTISMSIVEEYEEDGEFKILAYIYIEDEKELNGSEMHDIVNEVLADMDEKISFQMY